jgi:hypothetical protein
MRMDVQRKEQELMQMQVKYTSSKYDHKIE